MSTKANYFKIGMFVVATIAVLIIGIIVFSAGLLGREDVLMETYIAESVQGLSVGSPVTQMGVQIGRIEEIAFIPQEYDLGYDTEEFLEYSKYVILKLAIDSSAFPNIPDDKINEMVARWVANGLRLKISYQGITGIALLEAAYVDDPEKLSHMKIVWDPKRIYIPSVPSILTSFTESIDSIFQMLKDVDIVGISKSLDDTLKLLQKALKELRLKETQEELIKVVEEIKNTNKLIQGFIDEPEDSTDVTNFRSAIAQFNKTLRTIEQFVSTQQSDVEDIVVNMRRVSLNLRELTEQAKQYPAQVIFRTPPKQSEAIK